MIYFSLTASPGQPTLPTRLSRRESNLALSVVANGAIVACVAAPRGINSLMTVSEGAARVWKGEAGEGVLMMVLLLSIRKISLSDT